MRDVDAGYALAATGTVGALWLGYQRMKEHEERKEVAMAPTEMPAHALAAFCFLFASGMALSASKPGFSEGVIRGSGLALLGVAGSVGYNYFKSRM